MTPHELALCLQNQVEFEAFQAYCYGLHREGGDDFFSDSLKQALRYCSTIQNCDHLWKWLRRTAKNAAFDDWRRQRPGPLPEYDIAGAEEPPDVAFLKEIEAARVVAAVNELPPSYEAIVKMRYLLEMSLDEIAAELGISYKAASMRLHHAIEKLRRMFAPHVAISMPLPGQGIASSTADLLVYGNVDGEYSDLYELFLLFRRESQHACWVQSVGPIFVAADGTFEDTVSLPPELFNDEPTIELHFVLAVAQAGDKLLHGDWPRKALPSGAVDSGFVVLNVEDQVDVNLR